MATEPKSNASPICYLNEANDIYRGYAEITEISQLIRRWIKLSPSPVVARALTALLPSAPVSSDSGETDAGNNTGDTRAPDTLSAEILRDEMHRLLPRIGDDAMHATLKSIAETLSVEKNRDA